MKKYTIAITFILLAFILAACNASPNNDTPLEITISQNTATPTTTASQSSDSMQVIMVSGDMMWYSSINHIASEATDVVRAIVLDERIEWIDILIRDDSISARTEFYELYTVNRIEILEVFQGNLMPGEIIEIRQIGGEMDNVRVVSDISVSLEINDDLILFLMYFEQALHLPRMIVSPMQGAFRAGNLAEGERMVNMDEVLEGVHRTNDLTLTLNDLLGLSGYRD